jgi:hypothetical protein
MCLVELCNFGLQRRHTSRRLTRVGFKPKKEQHKVEILEFD